MKLQARLQQMLPPALLVALPLVLYAPFLFGGKVLYWGVYLLQFHPWRQLAVDQIRAGRWPLWNEFLGAGTPLAANLQTAVFYPPNALFLLMPVERAFGWELALHVALAGLFAYYLGRTLGLARFGALVAGLAYGLGGYIVSRWVFPSMVYAAAWLPLMLALADKLIRAPYRLRHAALLSLVIALQLLAGHAQSSFYSLVILALYALTRPTPTEPQPAGQEPPSTPPASRLTFFVSRVREPASRLAWLALATVGGAALAAVQLLPTAELAAHSQRAGSLTDLRFALELSLWPWRLITLLAPDFFGNPARGEYWAYGNYWEGAAFIGVLPFLLAVLAVVHWWQKRKDVGAEPLSRVPFFALLSILSLVLALGDRTPLYPLLFRYVPGFGLFQAPARLVLGYALGMALLAGIGAESLRLTPRLRTSLRIVILAGLGMAVAGALALALPAIRPSFGSSTVHFGLSLALAAGLLLLRGRRLRAWRWQTLVVALIVVDLLAFGWGLAPGTDPSVYRTPVASAEFLRPLPPGRLIVAPAYAQGVYDEYVSLRSFGSSEPAYLQGLRESLFPNLNLPAYLPGVANYDPLTVGLYRDLWDRIEGQRDAHPGLPEILPLLDLFGASYIVSGDPLPLPLIYDGGPDIYYHEGALPEAYVVPAARVVQDASARLRLLQDPGFDPRAEVILSRPPATPAPAQAAATGSDGLLLAEPFVWRKGPDRILIQIILAKPGWLVLTDTYYPGWQATVDGTPAEILPANHAFRAVALDPGDHLVVFQYDPLSFRLGAWITLGAALLAAATLGLTSLRRRAS